MEAEARRAAIVNVLKVLYDLDRVVDPTVVFIFLLNGLHVRNHGFRVADNLYHLQISKFSKNI